MLIVSKPYIFSVHVWQNIWYTILATSYCVKSVICGMFNNTFAHSTKNPLAAETMVDFDMKKKSSLQKYDFATINSFLYCKSAQHWKYYNKNMFFLKRKIAM